MQNISESKKGHSRVNKLKNKSSVKGVKGFKTNIYSFPNIQFINLLI